MKMYEEENIEPDFSNKWNKNPFKTPENYFESIEDRVMNKIKYEERKSKSSKTGKLIQLLKPALALAASFVLIYLLVFHPISYLLHKEIAQTKTTETNSHDTMDAYTMTFSLVDENSLINTIINEEKAVQEEINPDEVLAYLSSDMNDIEIYSEIQN